MLNEYTFMFLAITTLFALSFKSVKKSVVSALDKRINEIESAIKKSEDTRNAMHEKLMSLKEEYVMSKDQYKATIQEAKDEARSIISETVEQMNSLATKTNEMLHDYTKQADNLMSESVKAEVLLTVLTLLEKEITSNNLEKLNTVNEGVSSLKKIWN